MTARARTRVAPTVLFTVILATSLLWAMRGLRDDAVAFVGSGTDVVSGMVPHLSFIQKQLRAGQLPLWNPHIVSGQPELGGAQWAVFYPFPLLVLPQVSVTTYIKITLLVHLLLLGLGCYLLSRRWLRRFGCEHVEMASAMVGLVVPFSGFVMGHLYAGHVMMLQGLPYLPLMIWGGLAVVDGRRWGAIVCALSLSLVILAGGPQVLPMGFIAGAAVWGVALISAQQRARAGLRLMACVLAGIALSGPQLVPALELASLSLRSHLDLSASASPYTLSLSDLGSLIVPGLAAAVRGSVAWEFDAFIGVPLIALAILPLHDRKLRWPAVALWVVSALSLASAGGWAAGVLGQLPGYSLLRVPSRLLLVPVLLLPASAAMGFCVLMRAGPRVRLAAGVYALIGAMLCGLIAVRLGSLSAYTAWGWATLCALVWMIPKGGAVVRGPMAMAPGLAVFLLCAAGSFEGRPASQLGQLPRAVGRLFVQAAPQQRVISYLGRSWNRGMAEGFLNLGGYEPFASYRSALLLKSLSGADPRGPWTRMHVIWPADAPAYSPLWDVFAVRFALVDARLPVRPPLRLLEQADGMALLENPRALPRAYFHPCPAIVASAEEALQLLQGSEAVAGLPPAVVEGGKQLACPSDPISANVRIISDRPRETVVRVDSEVSGYLVLSDLCYPGWRATVDGKETPIAHANGAARALLLAPGSHRVRFHFEPASLREGALVALTGLGALIALTLVRRLW